MPGLYPEQGGVAALRGNDLVTLAVIVPALALLVTQRNPRLGHVGRRVARPALPRDLNYAYYAFGAAFSDVFLLHVAAVSASTYALILLGSSLQVEAVAARMRTGPAARVVAAFTTLLGAGLVAARGPCRSGSP